MRRIKQMCAILRHCRPHESETEAKFVSEWVDSLPNMLKDDFGNRILKIGESPVLFSCHTDTVHRHGGYQHVRVDQKGIIHLDEKKSDCLGADDGAGVFIMRSLILANMPGTYVFHRGEEKGGKGSAWIKENMPSLLTGIKAAIAFDRKGRKDIIVQQSRGRTASDEFAEGLAKMLKLDMKPSNFGTFTDTANYMKLVPECSNLSVGYEDAHSDRETLDFDWVETLIEAMLTNFKADELVIKRDPTKVEEPWKSSYSSWLSQQGFGDDNWGRGYSSGHGSGDRRSYGYYSYGHYNGKSQYVSQQSKKVRQLPAPKGEERESTSLNAWLKKFDEERDRWAALERVVARFPKAWLVLLLEMGLTDEEAERLKHIPNFKVARLLDDLDVTVEDVIAYADDEDQVAALTEEPGGK